MYEVLFSMFVTVTSNFIIIPDTGYNLWTWTETIMASIIFLSVRIDLLLVSAL